MEINRNQWFLAGMVLLLLGGQFRMIDSVELTPEFTKFLAERTDHPVAAASEKADLAGVDAPFPSKTFTPPEFIGWALLSVGSVLVLHALSMQRPE